MNRSVKLFVTIAAACALLIPASAFAGHNTYYKIKGGSVAFDISAKTSLDKDYGIVLSGGPFSLKKGGSVYQSANTLSADVKNNQALTLTYDTRGPNGHKAGTTTLTIKRLSVTIGKSKSFVIGNVTGSSTVDGVNVEGGEFKVFNIDGGKVKKSKSSKYKYTFSSSKLEFNSQITSLLNTFGTPKGTNKASAKVDLGSISVKVK
jgi:hypothetical protein